MLDLTTIPTIGNLAGKAQVWLCIVFDSDSDTNLAEGAYVDNILLRKCASACPASIIPVGGPAPDTLQVVPAIIELR